MGTLTCNPWKVLCWGATTLDPSKQQLSSARLQKAGKRDIPERWKSAAQRALRAADWAERPQIRTLQVGIFLVED